MAKLPEEQPISTRYYGTPHCWQIWRNIPTRAEDHIKGHWQCSYQRTSLPTRVSNSLEAWFWHGMAFHSSVHGEVYMHRKSQCWIIDDCPNVLWLHVVEQIAFVKETITPRSCRHICYKQNIKQEMAMERWSTKMHWWYPWRISETIGKRAILFHKKVGIIKSENPILEIWIKIISWSCQSDSKDIVTIITPISPAANAIIATNTNGTEQSSSSNGNDCK